MDKYLVVVMVFVVCILILIYTQIDRQPKSAKMCFKQLLQKEFPAYKVVERNQNMIICKEIPNRRMDEELVLIRIDAEQKKNLRTSGKMLIATYSKQPSVREMKKDFAAYL